MRMWTDEDYEDEDPYDLLPPSNNGDALNINIFLFSLRYEHYHHQYLGRKTASMTHRVTKTGMAVTSMAAKIATYAAHSSSHTTATPTTAAGAFKSKLYLQLVYYVLQTQMEAQSLK